MFSLTFDPCSCTVVYKHKYCVSHVKYIVHVHCILCIKHRTKPSWQQARPSFKLLSQPPEGLPLPISAGGNGAHPTTSGNGTLPGASRPLYPGNAPTGTGELSVYYFMYVRYYVMHCTHMASPQCNVKL